MRFSIRDLLLLTVIVALAVGWWVDHRKQVKESESNEKWRNRAGALEELLESQKWRVSWGESDVSVTFPGGSAALMPIDHCEPSPLNSDENGSAK